MVQALNNGQPSVRAGYGPRSRFLRGFVEFVSDFSILIPSQNVSGDFNSLHAAPHGFHNLHPAYKSILVDIDPDSVAPKEWLGKIESSLDSRARNSSRRFIEIPTEYGGPGGPDLPALASHLGMTPDELIKMHSGAEYEVAFLGFAPGFAYLNGLPEKLASPRLSTPRLKVPAGSVGIAGAQTGIYPFESPAGWRIIGRTNLKMFTPERERPSLLQSGDRVRFVPSRNLPWKSAGRAEETSPDPAIAVEEAGAFSTIQDLGRPGYAHLGVSRGGAADAMALRVGNSLLGNSAGAAAVEITYGNAGFRFLKEGLVVVSGPEAEIDIDGKAVRCWKTVHVYAGQKLRVGPPAKGYRLYLCVAGGIEVPVLLGSRSTLASAGWGGLNGRTLKAGDRLSVGVASPGPTSFRGDALMMRQLYESAPEVLRVTRGPQWSWFSQEGMDNFFGHRYEVGAEANRAGLRLRGPRVSRSTGYGDAELVSEGVANGAIQIAADGQPMILFCEQCTTGGYPKIANVIRADWHRIGQLAPGSRIIFKEVSLEEAWRLHLEQEVTLQSAHYGI